MTATGYQERIVDVGGVQLPVLRGGSGRPMLVLHGIEGPEGWLACHEELSRSADVLAPTHPGYGHVTRPEWLETVPQLALFYGWALQELGLSEVDLVGFGLGGWLAAQIAVACPAALRHLVLVDAAGLLPAESEALDVFVRPWREVIASSFHDADACDEYHRVYDAEPIVDFGGNREPGRAMSMRLAYRPYMHDPALEPLLGRLRLPTLVVWGADDRVMPIECGRRYQQAIDGARLEVIENCGHWPHYERPRELASLIRGFVAQ